MKYIKLLSLSILIFLVSSCSLNKTPITAQDFSSRLIEKEFKIVDINQQNEGRTINALVAFDPTEKYQFEFYEFETQAQANSVFTDNSANIDRIGSGSSSSASGLNWAFHGKSAGGTYAYISYIDTTLIYVRADMEYRQKIRDIIKDLKY
jgi:hypothetical protein